MQPKKSKIVEGTEYGLVVQIIGFSVFWALPALWMRYLVSSITHLEVNGALLWLALIVLNLATYTLGRDRSAGVNAIIIQGMIIAQLYVWIFT